MLVKERLTNLCHFASDVIEGEIWIHVRRCALDPSHQCPGISQAAHLEMHRTEKRQVLQARDVDGRRNSLSKIFVFGVAHNAYDLVITPIGLLSETQSSPNWVFA